MGVSVLYAKQHMVYTMLEEDSYNRVNLVAKSLTGCAGEATGPLVAERPCACELVVMGLR